MALWAELPPMAGGMFWAEGVWSTRLAGDQVKRF